MVTATAHELEIANVAYFMGYELARCSDGYALVRRYGTHGEMIKAPTLEEITKHLKH